MHFITFQFISTMFHFRFTPHSCCLLLFYKFIDFTNSQKFLKCLNMSCWFVTGHWSPFWIIWFISFNLCWPISGHSYIRWFTVWCAFLQVQVGLSMMWNRCKYALVLPCPVTIHGTQWITISHIATVKLTCGNLDSTVEISAHFPHNGPNLPLMTTLLCRYFVNVFLISVV